VPVSLYLLSVWLLHVRPLDHGRHLGLAFCVTAVLVLLASVSVWGVLATGVLLALLVAAMIKLEAQPAR
jgi:O-antigen ligase